MAGKQRQIRLHDPSPCRVGERPALLENGTCYPSRLQPKKTGAGSPLVSVRLPKPFVLLLAAATAALLASCGRRGPLEPPPGAAAACAPVTGTPPASQGSASPARPLGQTAETYAYEPAPAAPPCAPAAARRPFFLDPLL
ncbi:MAG: lipoprotein [Methylocapsa sp.]|nr:lipoprotein [Methylocapsa sp.]